jgi:hypothetical protein
MTKMTNPTEIADPLVERPKHYGGDEAMRMAEEIGWGRNGCLFSIAKYLYRLGAKDPAAIVQDAQKALWYARRLREQGEKLSMAEEAKLIHFWKIGTVNLSATQLDDVEAVVTEIFSIIGELSGSRRVRMDRG